MKGGNRSGFQPMSVDASTSLPPNFRAILPPIAIASVTRAPARFCWKTNPSDEEHRISGPSARKLRVIVRRLDHGASSYVRPCLPSSFRGCRHTSSSSSPSTRGSDVAVDGVASKIALIAFAVAATIGSTFG